MLEIMKGINKVFDPKGIFEYGQNVCLIKNDSCQNVFVMNILSRERRLN